MAQGSVVVFEEHTYAVGVKLHDYSADTHKVRLHSVLPATDTATPSYADFSGNECSGTNYTATGETANFTYAEAGGTGTMTLGTDITWTADASGPDDIKYALIYSVTAASSDAIATVDMTTDAGSTALDLADGDITISAGTAFTLAKA